MSKPNSFKDYVSKAIEENEAETKEAKQKQLAALNLACAIVNAATGINKFKSGGVVSSKVFKNEVIINKQ